MSDGEAKDIPDPKARPDLRGQDSEESRAAVAAQREAKKREKEAKKLAAKQKKEGGGPPPASEAPAAAPKEAVPAAEEPAPTAAAAGDKKDPKARPDLQGQDSEETRAAVAAQREAKKREKEAKKLAAKQKKEGGAAPAGEAPAAVEAAPKAAAVAPNVAEPTKPKTRPRGASDVFSHNKSPSLSASGAIAPALPPGGALEPSVVEANEALRAAADTPWLPFPSDASGKPMCPKILSNVHPRIGELGLLYQSLKIVGGNARALALIDALHDVLSTTPILNVSTLIGIERNLDVFIKQQLDFLHAARAPCAGMEFVSRSFTKRLFAASATAEAGSVRSETSSVTEPAPSIQFSMRSSRMAGPTSAQLAQQQLEETDRNATPRDVVLGFLEEIRDELLGSFNSLVQKHGPKQIRDANETILVVGRTSSIEVLLRSAATQKKFSVIVLDSAPLFEGKSLAMRLSQEGIEVTYSLITSACTLMPKVSKVFIGASAVLHSGDVLSRSGTAMVAAIAKRYRKPVLCFAESYKFTAKVWMGSLTLNEEVWKTHIRAPAGQVDMGPDGQTPRVATVSSASQRKAIGGDGYLYDLTPAKNVDVVVCEIGPLHPSAVSSAVRDREERESR